MTQTCNHCGNPIDADDLFCTACGQKIDENFNSYTEKNQSSVDRKNEPLTLGKCFFGLILLAIPFVNIICLLVWAFSCDSNTNAKNIARTLLITGMISIALFIFGIVQLFWEFNSFIYPSPHTNIEEVLPSIPWQNLDLPFDVSQT